MIQPGNIADHPRIAPRQRGAWIETILDTIDRELEERIAPRQRGAWIETFSGAYDTGKKFASPLGNEGRGLKRMARTSTS